MLYAKALLGKACSITRAHLRATGRKVTYRGVETDRASVTARYLKGGDWLLDPIVLDFGDSRAQGSYARKPSRDYRFLLDGSIRPQKINPWFGSWWGRLWQDFQIRESPLKGDFDVAGRWRDPLGNRRGKQLIGHRVQLNVVFGVLVSKSNAEGLEQTFLEFAYQDGQVV